MSAPSLHSPFAVPLDVLRDWAQAILERAGASSKAAEATAGSLVDANRRGLDSHGVVFLSYYLPRLRAGTTDGKADPKTVVDLPSLALVDGNNALGAYVATFAMELCCGKAWEMGAAVVVVRNSSHFGAASCYTELATRLDCIGIAMSNSDPGMAPEGALAPVLGTNPLAIAALPAEGVPPPSLDFATSVVAQGRIILAGRAGSEIPPDWAIGRDGAPTTDPAEALRNSVLPMAGHKGFALAFMIDVLAGCLPGASISPEITEGPEATGPQGTGHFFAAVHLEAVQDRDRYRDALERLAAAVHNAPRAPSVPPFLIPGEREAEIALQRRSAVPLTSEVVGLLRSLGDEYSVPFLGS